MVRSPHTSYQVERERRESVEPIKCSAPHQHTSLQVEERTSEYVEPSSVCAHTHQLQVEEERES